VRALRERRTVNGLRGRWELRVTQADRRSSALNVEAIQHWYPHEERLLWTTTPTCLQGVLDEIEEGLVEGKVVQPVGAVYSGLQGDGAGRQVHGFVMPEVPVAALEPVRRASMDAYELLEGAPHGPQRCAAWNAYTLHLYGDELLTANQPPGLVEQDTAEMCGRLFAQTAQWIAWFHALASESPPSLRGAPEHAIPDWWTPMRSQEQLDGMRETLDGLRTYLAYELRATPSERLEEVDRRLEEAALLWVERLPPELRRGIGYALDVGIDRAYELGRELATCVTSSGAEA
jgi:hypothetical protein